MAIRFRRLDLVSVELRPSILTIATAGAALPVLLVGTGIGLVSGVTGGAAAITQKIIKVSNTLELGSSYSFCVAMILFHESSGDAKSSIRLGLMAHVASFSAIHGKLTSFSRNLLFLLATRSIGRRSQTLELDRPELRLLGLG